MSNRLKNETSPYLLQHADNPVDWYPWGEEAFEAAKAGDKPIFLSIGYSTCHWCHVMERECFSDNEVAEILNKNFVSIKVDKEERPDIDSIYMNVCQAFTGSGGWPTSIFMTPEQKPFFAGTYFPKKSRNSMFGFIELLKIICDKWKSERQLLVNQAEKIILSLKAQNIPESKQDSKLLENAVKLYKKSFDQKNGGFGRAPKFPSPHNILFLLDYYKKNKDEDCLIMAELTLIQMYRGGLFDHIGYGFCRYSTDDIFLVPHFEKMLYDNALLILAYSAAYEITKKHIYMEIAEKTASYILSEMTNAECGFLSAQDSGIEGEEGKYYVFTPDEITNLLGDTDGESFNRHFDITKEGNFEGKNIPNLLSCDFTDHSFDKFLPEIKKYRKERYSLHTDDKILTLWNSLMIAAMCSLYRISKNEKYLNAAISADSFIENNLADGNTLYVSTRDGKKGAKGFLDDYAGFIFAKIFLFGATLSETYLTRARDLCIKVFSDFEDENGGFYLTGRENEQLIYRPRETYDGAMPSGNSLMAWNLVQLSHYFFEEDFDKKEKKQLDFLSKNADRYPVGYSMFLSALLLSQNPPLKITVVLAKDVSKKELPFMLPADSLVTILNEETPEFKLKNAKTTYYVCSEKGCMPPTNNVSELV